MAATDATPISWADGYLVDREGVVYSDRVGKRRRIKPWLNSTGYEIVSVRCVDGSRRKQLVHRIVARVFHGDPPDGLECRHKDGNNRNNRADNLAWGTRSENMLDTIAHGTHVSIAKRERMPRGERHGSRTKPHRVPRGEAASGAKITEAQAREVLSRALTGESISGIARALAIPRGAAKCVAQRKTWKHLTGTES
jgi:hypothetical protein